MGPQIECGHSNSREQRPDKEENKCKQKGEIPALSLGFVLVLCLKHRPHAMVVPHSSPLSAESSFRELDDAFLQVYFSSF